MGLRGEPLRAKTKGKLLVKHLEMGGSLDRILRNINRDTQSDEYDLYQQWMRELTDRWTNIEAEQLVEQLVGLGIWT